MTDRGGVEPFAVAAIEALGGAVEREAAGLYTVLWPDPASKSLAVRRLAFDPELVDEAPDAELVSFGSPVLEGLLNQATASGRVARAFLNAVAPASRQTAERLARSYRFAESVWTAQGGRPWWLPVGVFLFRARYLSDVQEEDLVEVAVSLADGRLFRRLGEAVYRHGLAAEPLQAWPMLAERPAGEAYAIARHEIEQRLLAPLGRRRRELEARLAREHGRAETYFTELVRELEEQHAALPPESADQARLRTRLVAIRLERDRRLAELAKKYQLSAEVSLRSVLRLYLPRVVFAGALAGKRTQAALTLTWDPLEQTGEPTRCFRCGALTYEIGLHRTGGVACPRCL